MNRDEPLSITLRTNYMAEFLKKQAEKHHGYPLYKANSSSTSTLP